MPIPIDRVFTPPPVATCVLCRDRTRYATDLRDREPQPLCRFCAEQHEPTDLPRD